ncbi:MAG: DUF790 family protein [Longimicrobiales bacterium]
MLDRTHVAPFLRPDGDAITVEFLRDRDGRIESHLERLLRLVRRLEGRPQRDIAEALRRQERYVRDAARLNGIARTLMDACIFAAPAGAARAHVVRDALFTARGALWPPVHDDERLPYETAALMLDITSDDVARLLYADSPAERRLERAPRFSGRALLDRYNLGLARGVLLNATTVALTATGGWRNVFRAVKLARLMYTIERIGRGRGAYRITITGPAHRYLARPQRYGARFARILPMLTRARQWHIAADVLQQDKTCSFTLDATTLPVRPRRGRPSFDSRFESALAAEFSAKLGVERAGWSLTREDTPIAIGDTLFLPDFTARHRDGREAIIEIVGFWTPEYLQLKLEKIRRAALSNLVLVVYQTLDAGGAANTLITHATDAPVVWFKKKPRIGPVMEAVESVARRR